MMYSPLGAYVSFATRLRERLVAGAVGAALGIAAACVLYLLGASS